MTPKRPGLATFAVLSIVLGLGGCVAPSETRDPAAEPLTLSIGVEETPAPESIYDTYLREAAKADELEQIEAARLKAEAARVASEDAVFRADLKAAVEVLVQRANEEAKTLDSQVYLTDSTFERIVYFVPGEGTGDRYLGEDWYQQDLGLILKDSAETVYPGCWKPDESEDTISIQWSDHFTRAVEQSYRYGTAIVLSMVRSKQEPYLRANVRISLELSNRSAIEGEPGVLPEEPSGYSYWHPDPDVLDTYDLRAAHGEGFDMRLLDVDYPLSPPQAPHGTLLIKGADLSGPAQAASQALQHVSFEKQTREMTLHFGYSTSLNRWVMRSPHSAPQSPIKRLHWLHGTEGYGGHYVGRPD